ncbi:MAG: hypothetical protein LLG40_13320 [Deltaproteobacteria bacterium]|nr:hypothetical protein [Deltaproteobacteria bacterium]
MNLIKKLKDWLKSKPDDDYIVQEAPDTDRDTARKMETEAERKTTKVNLFKWKF